MIEGEVWRRVLLFFIGSKILGSCILDDVTVKTYKEEELCVELVSCKMSFSVEEFFYVYLLDRQMMINIFHHIDAEI